MTFSDFSNVPDAPVSSDLTLLKNLGQALEQAHFTNEAIADVLDDGAFAALQRDQIVPARLRIEELLENPRTLESQKKLALLISLFMLGGVLTEQELSLALGEEAPQIMQNLRLVEPTQSETTLAGSPQIAWRAVVDLRPHSADDGIDIWVASDLPAHIGRASLRKDHVLGIGHASRHLAQFTQRKRVSKALDLGTGCGIQTFHLLAHCEHVIATDISERALAFTAFNLLLNADALNLDPLKPEERVSLRLGSLLKPVSGETFDLVVSNPPFVITPRNTSETVQTRFTYRDGGMAGDQIVSTLVRELPTVLAEGATAQMLGNWEIPATVPAEEGSDWSARPRSWVGEESEAWFIQREELSPEQYAETWLRDSSETADPQTFEQSYRSYLIDFASRGVGSIGFGMIWLRKPEPSSSHTSKLRRFEEITYPIQQPLAPFISESVELHDAVATLIDSQLEELHLVVADDVTEERHAQPGAEHPGVILLRQGAGLRRTILESTATAGFVSACDGELSVGQIVGALHALLDWEGTAEKVELLGHIRELILQGFLRIDAGE